MPESYIEPLTDRQVCFKCHKSVTGKKKLPKCSRCHAITYCGPQCQKADWDRHSWNCLPVMVTEFEGKGRGLVAAKDIKMGDLIFTDKPMLKLAAVPGGCLPDSTAMDSMMTQIGNLSSEAKKQFYKLKPPLESDLEFAFRYLNLPEYGRDEYDIFRNNCVHIGQYCFIYLNQSLVNHSCSPNAVKVLSSPARQPGMKTKSETRAIKDISKGEEITVCNIEEIKMLGNVRRMKPDQRMAFVCKCDVCSGKIPGQEDIIQELLKLRSCRSLHSNQYQKKPSDWRRDAKTADKIADLTLKLDLGKITTKIYAFQDLARAAQMARDEDLQKKALDIMKKFVEDTRVEEIKEKYDLLKICVAQRSSEMKSKEPPKSDEIYQFNPYNLDIGTWMDGQAVMQTAMRNFEQ